MIDANNPRYTEEVRAKAYEAAIARDRPYLEDIQVEHGRRMMAIRMQRRLDQALGAMARRLCGWSLSLEEAERKRINGRAELIVERLEKNEAQSEEDQPVAAALAPYAVATFSSRKTFDQLRSNAEKTIAMCATNLLVYSWVEAIPGVAAGSLGAVIGEAGNLLNYGSPARVWKRMGLAVLDGRRQGNPGKDATKEDWIAHGYNPSRRSICWNIGQALIKRNGDGAYRQAYMERKEYELARNHEMTKAHAHKRAQRFMEKRLLRDLWRAWRIAALEHAEKNGIVDEVLKAA